MRTMNNKKLAYMVIGCNGAGKTTYYNLILKDLIPSVHYINTDLISKTYQNEGKTIKEANYIAVNEALMEIMQHMDKEEPLAFESLFTDTNSKSAAAITNTLKKNGYFIEGFLIHTNTPDINIFNIEKRVLTGIGHFIDSSLIKDRYQKINENFNNDMIKIFDKLTIIDNSKYEFKKVISIEPSKNLDLNFSLEELFNNNTNNSKAKREDDVEQNTHYTEEDYLLLR